MYIDLCMYLRLESPLYTHSVIEPTPINGAGTKHLTV